MTEHFSSGIGDLAKTKNLATIAVELGSSKIESTGNIHFAGIQKYNN
jgi:hypothetical protein